MFIGKIVDRMDTCHPTSKKIKAKYEDATKTKYVAGLMDKAIAKVNQIQNELDWYENIFKHSIFCIYTVITTGYSLTAHSYLKSKFKMAFIWAVIT